MKLIPYSAMAVALLSAPRAALKDSPLVRRAVSRTEDSAEIEVERARFDTVYLKARVSLRSTKGALRLKPGATYCDHLFQMQRLETCDGRRLPNPWGDCVGPAEGTDVPVVLEQGVWIAKDEVWYVGEGVSCVRARIQAFYDGPSARLKGPVIEFTYSKAEGLKRVSGD